MYPACYAVAFVLGACVGSFVNVLVFRTASGEQTTLGRSHCPHCARTLSWWELVPVLGFFFVQGRCRTCLKPLSPQYPLVEFSLGVVFALLAWRYVHEGSGAAGALESSLLLGVAALSVAIFVYDFRHLIIPDKFVFPLVVAAFAYAGLVSFSLGGGWTELAFRVLSGLAVAGFFLLLFALTKGRGMGLGDVKFGVAMGMLLGWPESLVGVFSAFVIAAAASLYLMLWQGRGLKSKIPFGPFLIVGMAIAFIWGSAIVHWYVYPLS